MIYYCLLYIKTNEIISRSEIGKSKRQIFEIIDRDSPAERASAERLKKHGITRERPFRYYWTLSSKNFVLGPEPIDHVRWLLGNLGPKFNLSSLKIKGADYGFSFYWEGSGTGGGPLITPELSELLLLHKASISFGFYYSPAEG